MAVKPTLNQLLNSLNPSASLAERHLWLIYLLGWVRGSGGSIPEAVDRINILLDTLDAQPATRLRLQEWWAAVADKVDMTTLLADFGFAPRSALFSELTDRLRNKVLPGSPETIDASELFMLALPNAFDARWIAALDEVQLLRLGKLLKVPEPDHAVSHWRRLLLDAITYCAGQILSTGFAPELRLRMSEAAREAQPFHDLIGDVEHLRDAVLASEVDSDQVDRAAQSLRDRLEACRSAASTVYAHLEDHGISVGLVFRIRQLRERILRVRELLDCLLSATPNQAAARMLSRLVLVGQERRSLRALLATNSSLLAAKVAERSAETGSHYITRTGSEYRAMLNKAAGGGAVMAFTTMVKFGLYALALSAFWGGFWAGMNYAISFVLIQLLHCTVATKQPAMTAPAMAAKLKELGTGEAIESFVDEITHLVRSQVAAVLGNVLVVFPAVIGICALITYVHHTDAISPERAAAVIDSLQLYGPSLFFAAFTGVLLFASSIFAGWAENWFVLHRLDSAMRYNPRITHFLGKERASRWAYFFRTNISGFAANVSLGMMLGLVPAIALFFGLELDVRHVTLAAGQLGAAASTMGLEVIHESAFWWAVGTIPLIGALNVCVSFYMAFRLALRAQNVSGVERSRIYRAIGKRLLGSPLSFFMPRRRRRTPQG